MLKEVRSTRRPAWFIDAVRGASTGTSLHLRPYYLRCHSGAVGSNIVAVDIFLFVFSQLTECSRSFYVILAWL